MRYRKPMTTLTQRHTNSRSLIDFACSYTWRAYYAETIDGIILPPLEPKEKQEILPVIPPENKLYDRLEQAEGKLTYLQNKINQILDRKRKPKSKYD